VLFATGNLTITHFFSKRLALLPIAAMALTANAGCGGSSDGTAPQLVPMAPIIVPIVGSDRIDGALRLKLVLTAADAGALARLTERLPALRAATVASAIEFARLYVSPQTPVNAVQLRTALTTSLRTTDHDVADLLIIEVSAAAEQVLRAFPPLRLTLTEHPCGAGAYLRSGNPLPEATLEACRRGTSTECNPVSCQAPPKLITTRRS